MRLTQYSLQKEPVEKVIEEPKNKVSTILIAEDEYVNYLYLEELLDDYISKPIDAEIFKQKMQEYTVGG